VCEQLAQVRYAAGPYRESNLRPVDCKSDSLPKCRHATLVPVPSATASAAYASDCCMEPPMGSLAARAAWLKGDRSTSRLARSPTEN